MLFPLCAALLGAASLSHAIPAVSSPSRIPTPSSPSHIPTPSSPSHIPSYKCHRGKSTYIKTSSTPPTPSPSTEHTPPPQHKHTSSPNGGGGTNRFGFHAHQTATFTTNGPIATLSPNVHWSYDTTHPRNVRPVPVGKGSELYYGIGDARQAGHFAFLTYYFQHPSVNIDHSDHVAVSHFDPTHLTLSFSSQQAFDHAVDSWPTDQPLILVSYTPGCGDWDKGDRCYFQASQLVLDEASRTITATGEPKHPDTITTRGETKWGWWVPRKGAEHARSSNSTKPTFAWSPTSTSSPPLRPTDSAARKARQANGTQNKSAYFSGQDDCAAAPDAKYGLPTACLGPFFDQELDNALGYVPISAADRDFIDGLAPSFGLEGNLTGHSNTNFDDADPFWKLRRRDSGLHARGFWSWLWEELKKPFIAAYHAVKEALTISPSINKEISWRIPNPEKPDSDSNKLVDPNAKQVTSPWGTESIVIKSFGSQKPDAQGVVKYLNVFCVQCGVQGSARIEGHASWSPFDGFTAGHIELHTDVVFSLKIGIDAEIRYQHEFTTTLVNVGLPGLSFGVVTIGPYISVGTRVALEAAAKGRMLAGAEMGLHDARVVVDFIDSSKNERAGWEPYFKPVFEAEGEIMLSATLGLPVGLKIGIQVSKWEKAIGIIDEPSITGTAQVAASIGMTDRGAFSAGFHDTDGCAGISTRLSWRNKLWVDVLGLKQYPLMDTLDRPIARGCIALPPLVAPSSSNVKAIDTGSKMARLDSKPSRLGLNTLDSKLVKSNLDTLDSPPVKSNFTRAGSPSPRLNSTINFNHLRFNSTTNHNSTTNSNSSRYSSITNSNSTNNSNLLRSKSPTTSYNSTSSTTTISNPSTSKANSTIHSLTRRQHVARNILLPKLHSVHDLTRHYTSRNASSSHLTYTPTPFENHDYTDAAGLVYSLVVTPRETGLVMSCSNGNMYVVRADSHDNPGCSELWATRPDDTLVFDGTQKLMHYYTASMAKLGVSRVRVDAEYHAPNSSAVVVWALKRDVADKEKSYYVAVASDRQFFYPLVCDFADERLGAKVFLARDPAAGIRMLESPDLRYTVTGGTVTKCYNLVTLPDTLITYPHEVNQTYLRLGSTGLSAS